MDQSVIVGIDVGTTKICTLVARIEENGQVRILGVGIEPSQGIHTANVIDLNTASKAIARSIEKAERTSGLEIHSALISLSGPHVSSENCRGVVGISGRIIDELDIARAMESAQAVDIPHNREVVHVIQRGFTVDGQNGVRVPIGLHGYRLEVETHMVTAYTSTIENLHRCVADSGIDVLQFVLNPLASAEAVLSDTEREMGAVVCDIGGGTTDLAIFIDGNVWHTKVIEIGGDYITSDIAHGLRLPISRAEEIKKQHGYAARITEIENEFIQVRPFGEESVIQVSLPDLTYIIEARVEEIFTFILREIKRSGYDNMLPAGLVITGGTSLLPGIRKAASRILNMPVRTAKPDKLIGMVDQLNSPAFSTGVGLILWALRMKTYAPQKEGKKHGNRSKVVFDVNTVKNWIDRLLP